MKFKLFGRLRDDEEESSQQEQDSTFGGGGFGGNQDFSTDLESRVEDMFSQGYGEQEIKQELQGQYDLAEIEQAINNTVKSQASGGSPPSDEPEPMSPYDGPAEGQQNQDLTEQTETPPQQTERQQIQQQAPNTGESNVEELVETVVAENFDLIENEFMNVYEEIDELKDQVEDLDDRVSELEIRDDEDQQEFIQKVDEMEEHIDEYQSRIGGLEKAFEQVLPSLVDNVRELTNLVQDIKDEKNVSSQTDVSSDDLEDFNAEDWS